MTTTTLLSQHLDQANDAELSHIAHLVIDLKSLI